MIESIQSSDESVDLREQERRDFHSYLWGAALALALTVVPFGLVYWFHLPRLPVLIAIGVLALSQLLVHFRFFLHIGFRQNREDLQLLLFSALLLFVMLSGTIWIMASLALRMALPDQP